MQLRSAAPEKIATYARQHDGDEVVFHYRERANNWTRLQVRELEFGAGNRVRRIIELMVVHWSGVKNERGEPVPFSFEALMALEDTPGWEGTILGLGIEIAQKTNIVISLGADEKKEPTPGESSPVA